VRELCLKVFRCSVSTYNVSRSTLAILKQVNTLLGCFLFLLLARLNKSVCRRKTQIKTGVCARHRSDVSHRTSKSGFNSTIFLAFCCCCCSRCLSVFSRANSRLSAVDAAVRTDRFLSKSAVFFFFLFANSRLIELYVCSINFICKSIFVALMQVLSGGGTPIDLSLLTIVFYITTNHRRIENLGWLG
jgi:hypothetical protein